MNNKYGFINLEKSIADTSTIYRNNFDKVFGIKDATEFQTGKKEVFVMTKHGLEKEASLEWNIKETIILPQPVFTDLRYPLTNV